MLDVTEANESPREEIAELVARAQRRDFQAFETLVAMHRAKIYALALRMIRNPSEAAFAASRPLDPGFTASARTSF